MADIFYKYLIFFSAPCDIKSTAHQSYLHEAAYPYARADLGGLFYLSAAGLPLSQLGVAQH